MEALRACLELCTTRLIFEILFTVCRMGFARGSDAKLKKLFSTVLSTVLRLGLRRLGYFAINDWRKGDAARVLNL